MPPSNESDQHENDADLNDQHGDVKRGVSEDAMVVSLHVGPHRNYQGRNQAENPPADLVFTVGHNRQIGPLDGTSKEMPDGA